MSYSLLSTLGLRAQDSCVISGALSDATTGEALIGALGYFSASAVSERTIIVQE